VAAWKILDSTPGRGMSFLSYPKRRARLFGRPSLCSEGAGSSSPGCKTVGA